MASVAVASETIRFLGVKVEPVECRPNLAVNGSFEQVGADGMPVGWQWDRRNTDATCVVDSTIAHGGRHSLRITNGTPFGPHVYGMLKQTQPVSLTPGKTYTMSMWLRADSYAPVNLIGGSRWEHRVSVACSGGQWRRAWKTFTATEADAGFTLRINVEGPTAEVYIDDVKIEQGELPTFDAVEENQQVPASLSVENETGIIEGDGPFCTRFVLSTPRNLVGLCKVVLNTGEALHQPVNLTAGNWRLAVDGESQSADDAVRVLTVSLEDQGQETAASQSQLRIYSRNSALERLRTLGERLPALKNDLRLLHSRGQDVSYPDVAATVLGNFLKYAEEDARGSGVKRAIEQIGELEEIAARLQTQLQEALHGKRQFPAVPRWAGRQRPVVKGSSFLAPVLMPGGETIERPLFFTGFGHFGQVVADMEKWPHYGTNIIQIEFGPNSIFPAENVINDAPMRHVLAVLDRARESGVAVCLLISPHYLPHWALEKWPHLAKPNAGFLKYCLHAPEGRELLRRFIETAIGPLKDHPALHSICISNEPINQEQPCKYAEELWHVWLEKRHGEIDRLNARYGTQYGSFADVSLPDPCSPPPRPQWLDYVRFNQEFFADWHKALAEAVHSVAPNLPVHAKAMNWTMLNSADVHYGVDAYLFGQFSDINGNDAINFYSFGAGDFAQGWLANAMGHDLQRSVLDAPVFNSENHIIVDRETRCIPPEHVRAALWQAAIHGQSATTIWVWERTTDKQSDLAGSIMLRPKCTAAVGLTNLDLNRAAMEITSLQQAPPQVLILHSVSAKVWEPQEYDYCQTGLYTALSFSGVKIGFVTERQLESGIVPEAPVLFIPNVTHFSDAAVETLRQYKGRLVFVGHGKALSHDDYGRQCDPSMSIESIEYGVGDSSRELWQQLLARRLDMNLSPVIELVGPDGLPVWGVESRCAETSGGWVINLCNYNHQPTTVLLMRDNHAVAASDVLDGRAITGTIEVQPLEVRLLKTDDVRRGKPE